MSASHATNPKLLTAIGVLILIAVFTEFFSLGTTPNIDITGKEKDRASRQSGYVVSRVVDGDTVDVERDGVVTRVRLIGVNTPETVDPRKEVECFGVEASDYTKKEIEGENVSLEGDDTQSTYDKYGRLLAYIYNEENEMLNRKLIGNGYAYEYTYDAPYKYQKEFKSLQDFAKNEKRGLWGGGVCEN
jgi:micrococcal nuclease